MVANRKNQIGLENICPVCGYPELSEPAYNEYKNPSFDICSSCGYQFGKTDDDNHITHEQWRSQWIANGMIWDKGYSKPPKGWNPEQQLQNIGVKAVGGK
ncbi:MAG: hypothetical protein P4M15_13550 [Alphaproteobacteria bacterium]|nr:hypothetical protein [Alphaproteobacteria bacterium]